MRLAAHLFFMNILEYLYRKYKKEFIAVRRKCIFLMQKNFQLLLQFCSHLIDNIFKEFNIHILNRFYLMVGPALP